MHVPNSSKWFCVGKPLTLNIMYKFVEDSVVSLWDVNIVWPWPWYKVTDLSEPAGVQK